MALEDSTSTSSDAGPYEQFEKCTYDTACAYKDTQSGNCIFETCIVQNELPAQTMLWYFNCKICDTVDCIKPNQMKMHICSDCAKRMLAAEKKPFTCVFCGKSQSSNSKIFLSGICDTCFKKLHNAINCKYCGNA